MTTNYMLAPLKIKMHFAAHLFLEQILNKFCIESSLMSYQKIMEGFPGKTKKKSNINALFGKNYSSNLGVLRIPSSEFLERVPSFLRRS